MKKESNLVRVLKPNYFLMYTQPKEIVQDTATILGQFISGDLSTEKLGDLIKQVDENGQIKSKRPYDITLAGLLSEDKKTLRIGFSIKSVDKKDMSGKKLVREIAMGRAEVRPIEIVQLTGTETGKEINNLLAKKLEEYHEVPKNLINVISLNGECQRDRSIPKETRTRGELRKQRFYFKEEKNVQA